MPSLSRGILTGEEPGKVFGCPGFSQIKMSRQCFVQASQIENFHLRYA